MLLNGKMNDERWYPKRAAKVEPLSGFSLSTKHFPERSAVSSVPRCLCGKEAQTTQTPGRMGRWFEESVLQTHLLLLTALQSSSTFLNPLSLSG